MSNGADPDRPLRRRSLYGPADVQSEGDLRASGLFNTRDVVCRAFIVVRTNPLWNLWPFKRPFLIQI
ncbi:hypothetical protein EYF80_043215 [Liparis tanakae]|uniref:Uncharacterized protein n=1 Tax=Liparis tanakae TaxID=230148 RepID=A0A4Z2FZ45_9TELE|nr:hypothetical protein EYF80_043215 [Liparis tanakae]